MPISFLAEAIPSSDKGALSKAQINDGRNASRPFSPGMTQRRIGRLLAFRRFDRLRGRDAGFPFHRYHPFGR